MRGRRTWLASLALMSALGGCASLVATSNPPATLAGLEVAGTVLVPAALVSNNSGGLVSNNSGGLVSNNSGGLVSNNSGAYRIQELATVPLGSALVYLLDPDERFYVRADGQRLTTVTGHDGRYHLEGAPADQPIFVAALLDGNRRVVGYTLGHEGRMQVDVTVGTTYATEFLRTEARRAGKALGAYPLEQVQAIAQETSRMLDEGQLPVPDLTIGETVAMNRAYVVAFGSRRPALLELWQRLVGRRPLVVTVVAGNFQEGADGDGGPATKAQISKPAGIALDRDGSLLIADLWEYVIRRVAPDGVISRIAGGEPGTRVVPTAETGDANATAGLRDLHDLKVDADGNMLATFQTTEDDDEGFWILCRKEGSSAYGFANMQAGKVYRYGSHQLGFVDGDRETTRFSKAIGLALDDAGNLFVSDMHHNLIRRIDRATGQCRTVAGRVGDPELVTEQFTGGAFDGDGPALEHSLYRPNSLAWRRTATGEELFVWDGFNNALRQVTFTGGDYAHGQLTTLLGSGKQGPRDEIFLLDADRQEAPESLPGLAVDPALDRLYFADYNHARIRWIDLNTRQVRTLAGEGTNLGDDEAASIKIGHLGGLAVAPDHSLYFADTFYRVVRRVHLQHHLP